MIFFKFCGLLRTFCICFKHLLKHFFRLFFESYFKYFSEYMFLNVFLNIFFLFQVLMLTLQMNSKELPCISQPLKVIRKSLIFCYRLVSIKKYLIIYKYIRFIERYSLINMRQLQILFNWTKTWHRIVCWFSWIYLYLPAPAWCDHKIVLQIKTQQFYDHIMQVLVKTGKFS